MAIEPSLGRLVFSVAVRNTCQAFGSTRRDFLVGVICVSFGFCSYWYFKGLPVAMEQAVSVAAFTFGPLGIVVAIVFLWNLFLALTCSPEMPSV
ncbi:MAG: hypothetical protein KGJ66_07200 [Alphaproteobacteria bacterium]|nr:hypothetical protein [Alphaproteobacteria bacterium]